MTKKDAKQPCENCGEMTHFGNATGPRKTKRWCRACYDYWKKNCKQTSVGEVWIDGEKSYVRRTPYDGGGNSGEAAGG